MKGKQFGAEYFFSVTSDSVPGTRLILLKIVGWTQTGVLEKKDQFFIQCIKEEFLIFMKHSGKKILQQLEEHCKYQGYQSYQETFRII